MLSTKAVAELMNLGPDAIRRAERMGIIPSATRTPGGHRRWRVADVEMIRAALEAHRKAEPRGMSRPLASRATDA